MAKKPEVQYVYYTDGSAARALEPAILPSPRRNRVRRQNPQVQEQQIIEIEVLPIVCIAVCAVMLAVMIFGVMQLRDAYVMEAQLEAYLVQLEQTNAERLAEYESNIDIEAVEQKAIALGLVPIEQVQHMTIRVHEPEIVQEQSIIEQFLSVFADIFA